MRLQGVWLFFLVTFTVHAVQQHALHSTRYDEDDDDVPSTEGNNVDATNNNLVREVTNTKEEDQTDAFEEDVKQMDYETRQRSSERFAKWSNFRGTEQAEKVNQRQQRHIEVEDFREKLEGIHAVAKKLAKEKKTAIVQSQLAQDIVSEQLHKKQLADIRKSEQADKDELREHTEKKEHEDAVLDEKQDEESNKIDMWDEMKEKDEIKAADAERAAYITQRNHTAEYDVKKTTEEGLKTQYEEKVKALATNQRAAYIKRVQDSHELTAEETRKAASEREYKRSQSNANSFLGLCSLFKDKICPPGWKNQGLSGLTLYSKHYAHNPFNEGENYNDLWRWTHAFVCCAVNDSAAMDQLYVFANECPAGSTNTGLFGMIMNREHYQINPFHPGADYNAAWRWSHMYVCGVNSDDMVRQKGSCLMAKTCPRGWTDKGMFGLTFYKGHYDTNPFWPGGEVGPDWRWSHPYMCCLLS